MTMLERFKLISHINACNCDIQDTTQETMTLYNDLGDIGSVKPVCDLLNELNDEKEHYKSEAIIYEMNFAIMLHGIDELIENRNIDSFIKLWEKFGKPMIDKMENKNRFVLSDNYNGNERSCIKDNDVGYELMTTEIVQRLNDLNNEKKSLVEGFDKYQSDLFDLLEKCRKHSRSNPDNQLMLKLIYKQLGIEWRVDDE